MPKLKEYLPEPEPIEEILNDDEPSYSVRFAGQEFQIYNANLEDAGGESWGRATYAFFYIINSQLNKIGSEYRFFAINGGNDLFGIFLTPVQAEASRKHLTRQTDWPYLPKDEWPWYGMYHDEDKGA